MGKVNDTGVYQLDNGFWEYRIVINRKNLKVDTTCRQDDAGNPYKTKKAAKEARELKLVELKSPKPLVTVKDAKLIEVYNKYMATGTTKKAKSTITKQKSMWDNHINKNFGQKYISEITLEDLNNYVEKLYTYGDGIEDYKGGYAYKYVESFLKFFYLLFGCAYRDDLIDHIRYTKMFKEKGRLTMPSKTRADLEDEAEKAKAYTMEETAKMATIFQRGHCYTAFLIGFYLGLRISECFAVRYSNIDWINKLIKIDHQMNFADGVFTIGPVKTVKSSRTIDIPDVLWDYLLAKDFKRLEVIESNPDAYRATEVVLEVDEYGKVLGKIVGGDFINRKDNGELLTINSMKYWRNVIKDETGIEFKFHGLRRTHATMLANMNTPMIELMHRMGHVKFSTTEKYYIDANHLARELLKTKINDIETQMDAERKQLKSAVGTPDDDAKLQKFRETVLPILPEFDENIK